MMLKSEIVIFLVENLRHLVYFILLPFTPILSLVFKWLFNYVGFTVNDPNANPDFNFEVKDWRVYAQFFAYGDLGLGEAYMDGHLDVKDFRLCVNHLLQAGTLEKMVRNITWTPYYWAMRLLWDVADRNTPESGLACCEKQYNFDEEYFLMIGGDRLDHSMPYYTKADQTWTEGHFEKYKVFATKMGLKPGMEVLEIGCGFGSMSKYFADTHNVNVTAVTNSEGMGKATRKRCVGSKVSVIVCDWRHIVGQFDAIAVCEMAPHVGKRHLPAFFNKCHSLLKPGGTLVVQDYVTREDCPLRTYDLVNRHVYGGTYFYSLSDAAKFTNKHLILKEYEDMTPAYLRGIEVGLNTAERKFAAIVNKIGVKGARAMLWSWILLEGVTKAKFWGYCHYVFVREEDIFVNKFYHADETYSIITYEGENNENGIENRKEK